MRRLVLSTVVLAILSGCAWAQATSQTPGTSKSTAAPGDTSKKSSGGKSAKHHHRKHHHKKQT